MKAKSAFNAYKHQRLMNATVNVERLLLRVQCLCECPEVLRSSQFHFQFLFV